MHVGPLPEDLIRAVLRVAEELLRDPTARVEMARGIRWFDNFETGMREAQPTDGRSLTITVHGGAVEIEDSAEQRLARLMRDHLPNARRRGTR